MLEKLKKLKEKDSSMLKKIQKPQFNLTIASKLYFGFAVTLIFFITAITFAFVKMQEINHINETIQRQSAYTMNLQRIQYHVHQQLASIKEWTLTGDEKALKEAKEAKKSSQTLEQQLLKETTGKEKKDKLEEIIQADKLISNIWEIKLSPMVRDGHYQVAYHSMVTEDQPIFERLLNKTDEFVEMNNRLNNKLQQEAERASKEAAFIVGILGIAATALGTACSLLVTRSINRPLKQVISGARRIAEGDLTSKINVGTGDEMGQLAKVFNEMVDQLNNIISQLINYGNLLTEDSEHLLAGSRNVSANINKINELLTELASTANTEAQNASDALDAAVQAEQTAGRGNETVRSAVVKMNEIKEQSTLTVRLVEQLNQQSLQIKQMLDVVKNIAEQTNLLSLNASIEAARAGEFGRGFAVVANEVRELADNSRQSVREITGIINNIQENTEKLMRVVQSGAEQAAEGVLAVENTGKALEDIVESVQRNAELVKQISKATEEVSSNIGQVAASTQEVTSSMEEITNTSQVLDNMAEKLQQTVNNFKV